MKNILPFWTFLFFLYDISECSFIASKPIVEFGTEKYFAGRLWVERVYLKCSFTPLSDTSLLFQVYWYNDGQLVFTSSRVTAADVSSTHFRSENGLRLASKVSCAVISKNGDSDAGHISLRSEEFFAGIKTIPSPVKLERGRLVRVGLYPTLPFGCVFYYQDDKEPINCELEIKISTGKESNCDPHILAQDGCVLRMRRREWNVTQYITLRHVDKNSYVIPMKYNISLKSDGYSYGNEWGHFQQNINISLVEYNLWMGVACTINSHDVYMRTFNRRQFGIIQEGTYILYRNINNESLDMEVDVKLQSCGGGMCICGVAVIAGGDIFIIDQCGTPFFLGYTKCINNFIAVSKTDDLNYRVYLPFGTDLSIRLALGAMYVKVFPSSHDVRRSDGLCERLGTSQLITDNGVVSIVDDFIHAWRTVDLNTIKSGDYGTLTASTGPSYCSCRDDTHSTNCTRFSLRPLICDLGITKPMMHQCSSTHVFG